MVVGSQQTAEIEDIVTNMSPDDETTRNGGKRRLQTTNKVRRNLTAITKKASEDIRKYNRYHMRNDHDTKELEESQKNAEASPIQTDHIPRQAGKRNT